MMWFLFICNCFLACVSAVFYARDHNPGNLAATAMCLFCAIITAHAANRDRKA